MRCYRLSIRHKHSQMRAMTQAATADKAQAESAPKKRKRLILVDGSGYIFRAYHALPPLTRRDGTPVGAVYGFCTMLTKQMEQFEADLRTDTRGIAHGHGKDGERVGSVHEIKMVGRTQEFTRDRVKWIRSVRPGS